jgi:hypothetical protein
MDVPLDLPDSNGKPGDASKLVTVYILTGQSNIIGMGNLSGARAHYSSVLLSASFGFAPIRISPSREIMLCTL